MQRQFVECPGSGTNSDSRARRGRRFQAGHQGDFHHRAEQSRLRHAGAHPSHLAGHLRHQDRGVLLRARDAPRRPAVGHGRGHGPSRRLVRVQDGPPHLGAQDAQLPQPGHAPGAGPAQGRRAHRLRHRHHPALRRTRPAGEREGLWGGRGRACERAEQGQASERRKGRAKEAGASERKRGERAKEGRAGKGARKKLSAPPFAPILSISDSHPNSR